MKGNVIKYEQDNIDTDVIIPGTYLKIHDYNELAKHGKKIMTFPILKKWALGSQEEINQFLSSPPNTN